MMMKKKRLILDYTTRSISSDLLSLLLPLLSSDPPEVEEFDLGRSGLKPAPQLALLLLGIPPPWLQLPWIPPPKRQ